MKYPVLKNFRDKETGRLLLAGQSYSHEDQARLDNLIELGFLQGSAAGEAKGSKEDGGQEEDGLPEDDDSDSFPKHTGGGNYELSNGEKVKGKDKALAAEKELEARGE